ncbi:MAG: hypothetical protein JWO72_1917 [Caulobacteraceae bacterium]|nr:hypothetical protein [Caulobacteraceae bacterium]
MAVLLSIVILGFVPRIQASAAFHGPEGRGS